MTDPSDKSTSPESEAEKQRPAADAEAPPQDTGPRPGLAGLRVQIGSLSDPEAAKAAKPRPGGVTAAPKVKKASPPAESDPALAKPAPTAPELGPSEEQEAQPGTQSGPPNESPTPRRAKLPLPSDLEDEVEAALAGVSLDALLAPDKEADKELEPGAEVTGKVVSVRGDDVFVDLGLRHQGLVQGRQFEEPPEPGASLKLIVRHFDEEEGIYDLSLPGAATEVGDWSEVEEGLVVSASITGHNKGGLECRVGGLRGFIPAGQVGLFPIDDLAELVGEKFACVVTEANPNKRNLVLSRRAVLEREREEKRKKILAELEVGQDREGVVRSLQDFGAFVDLGGVDGLVHISQLSWERISHPREVLEVGQKIGVRVERFDPETQKISLTYRDRPESPWSGAADRYPPGSRAEGTVSKLMDFGAFVRLEPGLEGLVHISELSPKRIRRPGEVVAEGQQLEVQILSVDAEAQRMSLSLMAVQRPEQPEPDEPASGPRPSSTPRQPLRGGLNRPSGGEDVGLNW